MWLVALSGCFDMIGLFVRALWRDWSHWVVSCIVIGRVVMCSLLWSLYGFALMWLVAQKRGRVQWWAVLCCDWWRKNVGGASHIRWLSTSVHQVEFDPRVLVTERPKSHTSDCQSHWNRLKIAINVTDVILPTALYSRCRSSLWYKRVPLIYAGVKGSRCDGLTTF